MKFNVISPETTMDLLKIIAEMHGTNIRFGAGYTDLLLEIKKQSSEILTVINLAHLKDDSFISVKMNNDGVRIGSLVTASRITSASVLSKRNKYVVLQQAANKLASYQIRQVATVGGNLCTASPAGDISCALMALEAECEILSSSGNVRVVPIKEFFTDVRKTVLKNDEVLQSIYIPFNNESRKTHSDFIKIGTRRSMECSVVSLAYHIDIDENDIIKKAGVAIGSVAPTIKFTESACDYLIGKKYSSMNISEAETFAAKVVEYASPISDIRASAWYRKEALYNISKSIFINNE